MNTTSYCPVLEPPPPAHDRALDVVLVDEELPYPAMSGKRLRSLNLTLRLARRHNLTYLCHRNADAREASAAAEFFADHGVRTVLVDRTVPAKRGAGFYARLAANLFSPLPYSVASHTSPALKQALRRHAATAPVDLWHCEWTPYAEVLRAVTGPRFIMAHNVESVIWQRYHETATNPLKKWYIGQQWRKYLAFERRAVREADLTVAVSEVDAERFRRDFGATEVEVVDNGVDTAFFRPEPTPRDPGRLLFLGSLDWRPNLDGIEQLLRHVFPAVRVAEPGARLWVVGRNPPATLGQGAANVEVIGNVPDVRPYLNGCGALVVPLRIGGGSRLKILEALATGTPVVSTRVGAEGLNLAPDRHLTVVENVEDLAPALIAAIRGPRTAQQQAERGRRQVLRLYDWDHLADRLERAWWRSAANGTKEKGPTS